MRLPPSFAKRRESALTLSRAPLRPQKPPHKRFPRYKLTLAVYARYTALERMVATRLSTLVGHVPDVLLRFYVGIGWAAVGGAMSGASLVLAKATVMIGLGPESNVYLRPTPILTIILLALTAVLQMIALNRGLKCVAFIAPGGPRKRLSDLLTPSARAYSSTVVVPVFYAGYTLLGFANSMVSVALLPSRTSSPWLTRPYADLQVFLDRK